MRNLDDAGYAALAEASVVPLDIWYVDNLVDHGKYIAGQLHAAGYEVVKSSELDKLREEILAILRMSPADENSDTDT